MEFNDKQVQILKTAEKLFAEQGFDGTSIRSIAKEADINIAMISYYFGSKEKLLEALLIYRISDFRIELQSILDTNHSYLEKLSMIVAMIVKRVHDKRHTHKIVSFEFSNTCRRIDFNNYIEQKRENMELVRKFIEEGQHEGVFTKQVNPELLMPTIIGTYLHFYYNKAYYKILFDLKNDVDVENYVHTTLTNHIQLTVKALLTYED